MSRFLVQVLGVLDDRISSSKQYHDALCQFFLSIKRPMGAAVMAAGLPGNGNHAQIIPSNSLGISR